MIYNDSKDKDVLLLVKGKGALTNKGYSKELAKAIDACIAKHEKAALRCVGRIALDNAIRAISISRYNSLRRGEVDPDSGGELIVFPEFVDVNFQNDEGASDIHNLYADENYENKTLKGVVLVVTKTESQEEDINVDNADTLLRVKGIPKIEDPEMLIKEKKEYIRKLSNAIMACYAEHSAAVLRYIGYSACDNAIKSILSASERNIEDNKIFGFQPEFTTIEMRDDGGDIFHRSAVVLKLTYKEYE